MYYDQEQKMKKTKSIWLYVTVILLYFLLIGIVITVLLLAPKYTTFSSEITSHQDLPLPHPVPAVPYPSEENPIDGNVPYNYPKPFKPSQKDPLYPGINPRVLYRNDNSTNLTPSNRMLQNSKYKQV